MHLLIMMHALSHVLGLTVSVKSADIPMSVIHSSPQVQPQILWLMLTKTSAAWLELIQETLICKQHVTRVVMFLPAASQFKRKESIKILSSKTELVDKISRSSDSDKLVQCA